MFSQKELHVIESSNHGQTIQTGAFFCDDGSAGVRRVWRDGVLHAASVAREDARRACAAYAIGVKAGEEAAPDAKLLNAAELNMMAQNYFKRQGAGEQGNWNLAFENGYTEGFKKRHRAP